MNQDFINSQAQDYELPLFFEEEILTVYVKLKEILMVEGSSHNINMIQFEGEAKGPYFQGKVLSGGVDWQKINKDGNVDLSARYILEGVDNEGTKCHIAIENNGTADENGVVRTYPCIVTDSKALCWLEKTKLKGYISSEADMVVIHILK